MVAVDPRMPFKAKQSLVEDDVVRGFGVTPSDVEVISTRNIVLDNQAGQFGYIIGSAKFDINRHHDSGSPQLLYLFGIAPDNTVVFFGQFRPRSITLPPLDREEARQLPGLQKSTDSKDLACTAIELVDDGGDELQTQYTLKVTLSEMLGGGLLLPMSPVE
ncbi:hypothetical protein FRC04_006876 [Tulasnella sp. 424]|nr:hypothetical protein FRC04_006876 [Tulasnella sp. 424]KAG8974381.1 hypothetical protein FRC05_007542 [Tulasnella sp. 425]